MSARGRAAPRGSRSTATTSGCRTRRAARSRGSTPPPEARLDREGRHQPGQPRGGRRRRLGARRPRQPGRPDRRRHAARVEETIPVGRQPGGRRGRRRRRLGLDVRRLAGLADPPRDDGERSHPHGRGCSWDGGRSARRGSRDAVRPSPPGSRSAAGRGARRRPHEPSGCRSRSSARSRGSTSRTRRVVKTIKLGAPPRFTGYLDSAVLAGGSVWVARDVGDEIDRIDPKTNRLVARIKVDSRPGGLAAGGGYVWAFHFLGPYLTRIDAGHRREDGLHHPGCGRHRDRLRRRRRLAPDRDTVVADQARPGDRRGARARPDRAAAPPPKHGIVDTWWVAAGGGSLWLANANFDRVTRVDEATAKVVASIPVPVEIPFGVAYYRGAAWVAGAGKVVRIDPATNRAAGTVTLSARSLPVFTQVAAGSVRPLGDRLRRRDSLPAARAVASRRERARPRPPPPDRGLPRGVRGAGRRAVRLREARVGGEAPDDDARRTRTSPAAPASSGRSTRTGRRSTAGGSSRG